ncbi:MAG: hypothetical protein JO354_13360 [Verrucomicrobia bacterium]|nr:hypothetical protein [Verrucomicrobiota bacterium]
MPALSLSNFIGGLIFSSIGFVAFTYGRRMGYWIPMLCGIGLMVLPLFADDALLFVASAVLCATAVVFRHS